MPIYDYLCEKCGHEFEREQRITEDPIKRCPRCKSLKAKRLISNTSFVLKGSGWYKDLYSSKPSGGGKEASSESGEGKSKGEGKGSKDAKSGDSASKGGESGSKGGSKSDTGTKASKSAA